VPSVPQVPPTHTYNPSSVTETESDIENIPQPPVKTPIKNPPKNDPSSVTEPESDVEDIPQPPVKTPIKNPPENDPSSVTEPESDVEDIPQPPIKTPIKKKGFFDTPSPPAPDSLYWKYVSCEEDAKWYDRSRTDNSFLAIRQMKQELTDLTR